MTTYQLRAFLNYRRRATGRHGVHSPFVYGLLNDCLRQSSPAGLEEKLLLYFKDWRILQPATPAPDGYRTLYGAQLKAAARHTMLLLPHIHYTPEHTAAWSALIAEPAISLSIDLYKIGLLFFNEDVKEKQHFVLKWWG